MVAISRQYGWQLLWSRGFWSAPEAVPSRRSFLISLKAVRYSSTDRIVVSRCNLPARTHARTAAHTHAHTHDIRAQVLSADPGEGSRPPTGGRWNGGVVCVCVCVCVLRSA
jgi:hypothetical protein